MTDEEIIDAIKEQLPGTACRVIHADLCEDMSEQDFRILFNRAAGMVTEDEPGDEDDVSP